MFIFVGQKWKTSIIRKKLFSPDYRGFPDSADTNRHWISILQVKKTIVSLQSGKFPLSRKFRVDISECHAITVTK